MADRASDWMSLAIALPFAWEGYNWKTGKSDAGEVATFLLTAVEIGFLQNGMNLLVRSLRLWPRPELYSSGADISRGEAWGSFYSGHTSAAFALAVFGGMWFDAKNPGSSLSPVVWSVSLASASLVSVLRVWAGKHYPSDVLAGAAIGSLSSFAVLRLHRLSAGLAIGSSRVSRRSRSLLIRSNFIFAADEELQFASLAFPRGLYDCRLGRELCLDEDTPECGISPDARLSSPVCACLSDSFGGLPRTDFREKL